MVISFHKDDMFASCHNLLLTLPSLMTSSNGKYDMIVCIISVGTIIRLADVGVWNPLDVVGC